MANSSSASSVANARAYSVRTRSEVRTYARPTARPSAASIVGVSQPNRNACTISPAASVPTGTTSPLMNPRAWLLTFGGTLL